MKIGKNIKGIGGLLCSDSQIRQAVEDQKEKLINRPIHMYDMESSKSLLNEAFGTVRDVYVTKENVLVVDVEFYETIHAKNVKKYIENKGKCTPTLYGTIDADTKKIKLESVEIL